MKLCRSTVVVTGTAVVLGLTLPLSAGTLSPPPGSRMSTSPVPLADRTIAPPPAAAKNKGVYPLDSKPFGKTYGEWGLDWWRWALSIPYAVTPYFDETGAQCATLQQDKVWFLAGTGGGGPVERNCTIPKNTALFFPIVTFLNDYPCPPSTPPFEPAAGQSIADFLTVGAADIVDLVDLLEAEVDGDPIADLDSYRANSRLGSFTGAANLAFADPCLTGSPQLGVSDGYWLMLKPLSRGTHVVHFRGGISAWSFEVEVTYNLTVD